MRPQLQNHWRPTQNDPKTTSKLEVLLALAFLSISYRYRHGTVKLARMTYGTGLHSESLYTKESSESSLSVSCCNAATFPAHGFTIGRFKILYLSSFARILVLSVSEHSMRSILVQNEHLQAEALEAIANAAT